jgi:hypothetical protein
VPKDDYQRILGWARAFLRQERRGINPRHPEVLKTFAGKASFTDSGQGRRHPEQSVSGDTVGYMHQKAADYDLEPARRPGVRKGELGTRYSDFVGGITQRVAKALLTKFYEDLPKTTSRETWLRENPVEHIDIDEWEPQERRAGAAVFALVKYSEEQRTHPLKQFTAALEEIAGDAGQTPKAFFVGAGAKVPQAHSIATLRRLVGQALEAPDSPQGPKHTNRFPDLSESSEVEDEEIDDSDAEAAAKLHVLKWLAAPGNERQLLEYYQTAIAPPSRRVDKPWKMFWQDAQVGDDEDRDPEASTRLLGTKPRKRGRKEKRSLNTRSRKRTFEEAFAGKPEKNEPSEEAPLKRARGLRVTTRSMTRNAAVSRTLFGQDDE